MPCGDFVDCPLCGNAMMFGMMLCDSCIKLPYGQTMVRIPYKQVEEPMKQPERKTYFPSLRRASDQELMKLIDEIVIDNPPPMPEKKSPKINIDRLKNRLKEFDDLRKSKSLNDVVDDAIGKEDKQKTLSDEFEAFFCDPPRRNKLADEFGPSPTVLDKAFDELKTTIESKLVSNPIYELEQRVKYLEHLVELLILSNRWR